MPVKPGAFMPVGNIGKPMSSLDLKNAKDIHERIVPPMVYLRNRLSGLEAGFRM
jgi:hypothetical protein